MIPQSNIIFAALAIGFVIYVSAKGSLKKYVDILTGNVASATDQSNKNADVTGKTDANIAANAAATTKKATQDLFSMDNSILGKLGSIDQSTSQFFQQGFDFIGEHNPYAIGGQ